MESDQKNKNNPTGDENRGRDYDRLEKKPAPANQPGNDEQTLLQKLEQLKKDPSGKPWQSTHDQLKNAGNNKNDTC